MALRNRRERDNAKRMGLEDGVKMKEGAKRFEKREEELKSTSHSFREARRALDESSFSRLCLNGASLIELRRTLRSYIDIAG